MTLWLLILLILGINGKLPKCDDIGVLPPKFNMLGWLKNGANYMSWQECEAKETGHDESYDKQYCEKNYDRKTLDSKLTKEPNNVQKFVSKSSKKKYKPTYEYTHQCGALQYVHYLGQDNVKHTLEFKPGAFSKKVFYIEGCNNNGIDEILCEFNENTFEGQKIDKQKVNTAAGANPNVDLPTCESLNPPRVDITPGHQKYMWSQEGDSGLVKSKRVRLCSCAQYQDDGKCKLGGVAKQVFKRQKKPKKTTQHNGIIEEEPDVQQHIIDQLNPGLELASKTQTNQQTSPQHVQKTKPIAPKISQSPKHSDSDILLEPKSISNSKVDTPLLEPEHSNSISDRHRETALARKQYYDSMISRDINDEYQYQNMNGNILYDEYLMIYIILCIAVIAICCGGMGICCGIAMAYYYPKPRSCLDISS